MGFLKTAQDLDRVRLNINCFYRPRPKFTRFAWTSVVFKFQKRPSIRIRVNYR